MTQREAVYTVLDQIGDRTKLQMVADRASMLYGSVVPYSSACMYRGHWRAENDIEGVDCRTYAGQPRRNMQNDNAVNLQQVKRLATFLRKVPANALTTLIGEGAHAFHSVEQMKTALQEYAYLRAAA